MITSFSIAADHPCLPGHFPGRPVVPGVVILERVLDGYRSCCGAEARGIASAKFVGVVQPGDVVELRFDARARFECRVADTLVAQGRLQVAA